ncbi:MAG: alpha/beta fold hydrolase [Actinomycetaceae bacterium]
MTQLAVHHHGPGSTHPPLVLLHAFPLDSRMYARLLPHLEDASVLTVDLPGFGDSPAPGAVLGEGAEEEPSLERVASAVLASLDALGVERFVVAGTSLGGYLAMRIAALAPERLAGIGLIDTKASPDTEEARSKREDLATRALGEEGAGAVAGTLGALLGGSTKEREPGLVDAVAGWAAEAGGPGIAYAARAMAARPDSTADLERLGELEVPALVVRGTEDGLASADDAMDMAEALGTDAMAVEGVGHLAPLEAPTTVGRALRDLVEHA